MSKGGSVRSVFVAMLLAGLAACASGAGMAHVAGCYRLVNGQPLWLNVRADGTASIGTDRLQREIHWSGENDQVFLELPEPFYTLLATRAGFTGDRRTAGGGYFGLIPRCGWFGPCRLDLDLDGRVYFRSVACGSGAAGGRPTAQLPARAAPHFAPGARNADSIDAIRARGYAGPLQRRWGFRHVDGYQHPAE